MEDILQQGMAAKTLSGECRFLASDHWPMVTGQRAVSLGSGFPNEMISLCLCGPGPNEQVIKVYIFNSESPKVSHLVITVPYSQISSL